MRLLLIFRAEIVVIELFMWKWLAVRLNGGLRNPEPGIEWSSLGGPLSSRSLDSLIELASLSSSRALICGRNKRRT